MKSFEIIQSLKLQVKYDNKGNASMLVIIGLVVVFAIMLSGGAGSLTSGTTASAIPSPTEAPLSTTTSPQPTTAQAETITIQVNDQCETENGLILKKGTAFIKAPLDGYIQLQTEEVSGNFNTIDADSYISPEYSYNLSLRNSQGFNTKNWRVNIYSGGTKSNNTWTGGTLVSSSAMQSPTQCQ